MTELLAESGYDMIGVDNSEEMLGEAWKREQSPDMRSFIWNRI